MSIGRATLIYGGRGCELVMLADTRHSVEVSACEVMRDLAVMRLKSRSHSDSSPNYSLSTFICYEFFNQFAELTEILKTIFSPLPEPGQKTGQETGLAELWATKSEVNEDYCRQVSPKIYYLLPTLRLVAGVLGKYGCLSKHFLSPCGSTLGASSLSNDC